MEREHKHVSIDYYAYISGIRGWNTDYKVFFAVAALILVIALNSVWVSGITILYMAVLTLGFGKIKLHDYLHLMTVPFVFIVLGTIAILVQHGDGSAALASVPFLGTELFITEKSLAAAGSIIWKAFAAISALYMMTLSTPVGEIISVFRKLHVPSIILELMHLIYRYIFILLEINTNQRIASMSRLGYCDYRTSLRTFGSEIANLFLMSMRKSESYYDAMEARGYEGELFFWEEKHKLTWGQIFAGLIYFALAAGAYMLQHII